MEKLYTDASFSQQSGIGGIAIVAPEWSAIYGGGQWRSRWDIQLERDAEYGVVVFCASCQCKDTLDAEKRALEFAFLLAYDMIAVQEEAGHINVNVEVVTDSLVNINLITMGYTGRDPILRNLCKLWQDQRIILTKVKAHSGDWGNELADKCSRHIRRKVERNNLRGPHPAVRHVFRRSYGIFL